jgi:hypothetical protein
MHSAPSLHSAPSRRAAAVTTPPAALQQHGCAAGNNCGCLSPHSMARLFQRQLRPLLQPGGCGMCNVVRKQLGGKAPACIGTQHAACSAAATPAESSPGPPADQGKRLPSASRLCHLQRGAREEELPAAGPVKCAPVHAQCGPRSSSSSSSSSRDASWGWFRVQCSYLLNGHVHRVKEHRHGFSLLHLCGRQAAAYQHTVHTTTGCTVRDWRAVVFLGVQSATGWGVAPLHTSTRAAWRTNAARPPMLHMPPMQRSQKAAPMLTLLSAAILTAVTGWLGSIFMRRLLRFNGKHRYWVKSATPPEDYVFENLGRHGWWRRVSYCV